MSALMIAVFSARSAETPPSAASVFMDDSSWTSAYEDRSDASCRIRLVLSVVASDWVGRQHRRGSKLEERPSYGITLFCVAGGAARKPIGETASSDGRSSRLWIQGSHRTANSAGTVRDPSRRRRT